MPKASRSRELLTLHCPLLQTITSFSGPDLFCWVFSTSKNAYHCSFHIDHPLLGDPHGIKSSISLLHSSHASSPLATPTASAPSTPLKPLLLCPWDLPLSCLLMQVLLQPMGMVTSIIQRDFPCLPRELLACLCYLW